MTKGNKNITEEEKNMIVKNKEGDGMINVKSKIKTYNTWYPFKEDMRLLCESIKERLIDEPKDDIQEICYEETNDFAFPYPHSLYKHAGSLFSYIDQFVEEFGIPGPENVVEDLLEGGLYMCFKDNVSVNIKAIVNNALLETIEHSEHEPNVKEALLSMLEEYVDSLDESTLTTLSEIYQSLLISASLTA